jgi:hypothetical protein
LAAPASEPALHDTAPGEPTLICAPDAIFDRDSVLAALAADLEGASDNKAIRAATVARLKTAIEDGRAAIEKAWPPAPAPRARRWPPTPS